MRCEGDFSREVMGVLFLKRDDWFVLSYILFWWDVMIGFVVVILGF